MPVISARPDPDETSRVVVPSGLVNMYACTGLRASFTSDTRTLWKRVLSWNLGDRKQETRSSRSSIGPLWQAAHAVMKSWRFGNSDELVLFVCRPGAVSAQSTMSSNICFL
jgi:hypothetical protein